MPRYKRELVFSGDDLLVHDFPERTRVIYPPPPLAALPDEKTSIAAALDRPLDAQPIESQVGPASRVLIAFDDPCIPIPPMRNDPRGRVIEAVMERLYRAGVKKENIRLLCAGGLHRKWTLPELATILGAKIVAEFGDAIACHDAEAA